MPRPPRSSHTSGLLTRGEADGLSLANEDRQLRSAPPVRAARRRPHSPPHARRLCHRARCGSRPHPRACARHARGAARAAYLGARGLRAPTRPGGHLRAVAERAALRADAQCAAEQDRGGAHALRGRLHDGSRRSARPRALPRAHGVQRQPEHPGRRDGEVARAAWARLRSRYECVHQLPRDGLPAGPAGHPRRVGRQVADADARDGGPFAALACGDRPRARCDPLREAYP